MSENEHCIAIPVNNLVSEISRMQIGPFNEPQLLGAEMDKHILLDLANETARRYGDLPSTFAVTMAKRIQRKYSVRLETQEIAQLALNYKDIYKLTKAYLVDYLRPPKDEIAMSGDVEIGGLLDRLMADFPDEDGDILHKIIDWIVYYEYLQ